MGELIKRGIKIHENFDDNDPLYEAKNDLMMLAIKASEKSEWKEMEYKTQKIIKNAGEKNK